MLLCTSYSQDSIGSIDRSCVKHVKHHLARIVVEKIIVAEFTATDFNEAMPFLLAALDHRSMRHLPAAGLSLVDGEISAEQDVSWLSSELLFRIGVQGRASGGQQGLCSVMMDADQLE